jgi:hypothetical protein
MLSVTDKRMIHMASFVCRPTQKFDIVILLSEQGESPKSGSLFSKNDFLFFQTGVRAA